MIANLYLVHITVDTSHLESDHIWLSLVIKTSKLSHGVLSFWYQLVGNPRIFWGNPGWSSSVDPKIQEYYGRQKCGGMSRHVIGTTHSIFDGGFIYHPWFYMILWCFLMGNGGLWHCDIPTVLTFFSISCCNRFSSVNLL